MIVEKLKDWRYYYEKLPLYMRNSYGIPDHFKMLFDGLIQIDTSEDEICKCFDLMSPTYETDVIAKYDSIDGDEFDFLDVIAEVYGVKRTFDVTYFDTSTQQEVTKKLHLTNKELHTLIKGRIIQNNYDGSYQQAKQYYDMIGLDVHIYTDTDNAANCFIYLGLGDNSISSNIQAMFLAGLLTIKSIGITYSSQIVDFGKAGIWADMTEAATSNNQWDESEWL